MNNRPAPRAAQLVPEVFVVQPHSRPPALESIRALDPLARGEQLELARAAVHLARRIGAAVLVRVHVSADTLDPWAAWGLLEAGPWGRVESAWAEPPGGTTLLAAGVAAQLSTSLDGAASRCRPLFERWIDARADVPAAVAGFAFAFSNRYGPVHADDGPLAFRRIWIDSTDTLKSFEDKVSGRLDVLRLQDSALGIRARRLLNDWLGTR